MAQLYGLDARDAVNLSDFEVNYLAESAKVALLSAAAETPQLRAVVQTRAGHAVREIRAARAARAARGGSPSDTIGPPPEG